MKRNNVKTRKLHLDAQTLRKLTADELATAAGAGTNLTLGCIPSDRCTTACPTMRFTCA